MYDIVKKVKTSYAFEDTTERIMAYIKKFKQNILSEISDIVKENEEDIL